MPDTAGTPTTMTTTGMATTTTGAGPGATPSTTATQPNIGATDPTATRDATTTADPNARAPVPIESSGGSAIPTMGAKGKDMPECMAAWDDKTHITKVRWCEICARTLNDPAHL